MRSAPLLRAAVIVPLLAAGAAKAAAQTPTPGCSSLLESTTAFNGTEPVSNSNLNAWGILFAEAGSASCLDDARQGLGEKIKRWFAAYGCGDAAAPGFNPAGCGTRFDSVVNASVLPFQGWLDGADVSLIMSAPLRLGGNSKLTSELDRLVTAVGSSYDYHKDLNCGLANLLGGNACMDDHSVSASGFGWIAAYEYKRGRYGATYQRAVLGAQAQIAATFSTNESICINIPTWWEPLGSCNGRPEDLDPALGSTGIAVYSLNHGQRNNIPYGLGLLTSVASALIGLEEAGNPYPISSDITFVAQGLLAEAQAHLSLGCTYPQYGACTFSFDCAQTNPGGLRGYGTEYCGDSRPPGSLSPLTPSTYPVYNLYNRWFGGIPSGYAFWAWDPGALDQGRVAVYKTISSDWVYPYSRPALSGLLNDNAPRGFLDGIDGQGCAAGWACDPDAANASIPVELRVDGWTYFTTPANLGSEPAVNAQCGGGYAHRFRYCLPAWTAGRSITAYGRDSTPNAPATLLPGWTCGATAPACTWTAVNNFAPQGYLDGIDANGCASGWTCDRDAPNTSIEVRFYANQYRVASTIANQGSEAAVNDLCGGGFAHRFRYCLPGTTAGQRITAEGIDTVSGATNLPGWLCPQNPACVWPPTNNYLPRGYLDGIDAGGCAWGWACDPDAPAATIPVNLYADGVFAGQVTANQGSEDAVNQLCGGGGLHRFRACLGPDTRGKRVLAYGLDTIGGTGLLPGWQCAATYPACTW